MIRRLIASGLLFAAAAFATTGCVVEVTFDPFGSDFSAAGSWTVNGATPTAGSCSAAGIDRVRVVFYDGGSPYFYDQLTFPCSDGSFSTGQIFAWGSYETEWQALLTDGTIARGPRLPLIVNSPITHADLAPADFVVSAGFDPSGSDRDVSADWNIDGAAGTTTSCAAAGIATIAIVLYDGNDTGRTDGYEIGSAACGDGKWDSPAPLIRDGSYLTSIQAFDSADNLLASYDSTSPFDSSALTPGARMMLMTAEFTTATTTSLTVTLQWDTDPSSAVMTAGTCATAGVDVMSYMLTDTATSTNYNQDFDVTCAGTLSWTDIPAGTYHLWVEGGTMAVKNWVFTCPGIAVVEGVANTATCLVVDVSGG